MNEWGCLALVSAVLLCVLNQEETRHQPCELAPGPSSGAAVDSLREAGGNFGAILSMWSALSRKQGRCVQEVRLSADIHDLHSSLPEPLLSKLAVGPVRSSRRCRSFQLDHAWKRQREREKERERVKEKERERERETANIIPVSFIVAHVHAHLSLKDHSKSTKKGSRRARLSGRHLQQNPKIEVASGP